MTVKSQMLPPHPKAVETFEYESAEARLPYWARSTNPIVRRHLGLYWRTVPPEVRPFILIFGVWVVLLLVGMLIPPIFAFTMISYLASIMVLPFAMGFYAYLLLQIAVQSASTMQQEMNNNTLQLLRTTPMSLGQIFLGKVAAAIWRRMDDLIMIAQLALAFSPPILFTVYSAIFRGDSGADVWFTAFATIVGMVITVLRIFVEPIMVGILSIYIGIVIEGRSRAITSAVVVSGFYFLILNLLSQLPMVRGFTTDEGTLIAPNLLLVLLTDFILPLVLPILISYGLLRWSERVVTSD